MTIDNIKISKNGYEVEITKNVLFSVVGGKRGLYGDGIDTFETAIKINDKVIGDVKAWQSAQEVQDTLSKVLDVFNSYN